VRRQDQEYLFLSLNDPWLLSAPPMLHPSELNVRPEAFFLVLRIVSRALISNMLDKLSITELHFQLLDIFFLIFDFEITVHLHVVVRNNIERFCVHFTWFP
jgi:hypothetical protein